MGNYLLKAIARANPEVQVMGMSRRGGVRGDQGTEELENVSFIAGNCLHPNTFENKLEDVDAVVHAVGTLFGSRTNPELTQEAMNRDSCINMGRALNQWALEKNQTRNFVMISSAKAPVFAPSYLTTKREAEKFLLEECHNLKKTIIRPGVVVDREHRSWSVPLAWGNDAVAYVNDHLLAHIPGHKCIDWMLPATST